MMRHRGPISLQALKAHPRTGATLMPVGYRKDGRAIWPVIGAAEGDGEDDDASKGGGTGDSGAGGGDDGDKGGADSGGSDGDAVSKAEFDALKKRMEQADRRASEAEKQVKAIEDAKKDDLTKATEAAEALEKQVSDLQTENRQLRLDKAFLSIKDGPNWHDPATALDLADRHGYLENVVSDDGEVDNKGLKAALERLAKEKTFLVNTDKADDEPDGPSGEPAGGRSDNLKDTNAKRAQLRRRFPAIR